jgi:hypothetical protein
MTASFDTGDRVGQGELCVCVRSNSDPWHRTYTFSWFYWQLGRAFRPYCHKPGLEGVVVGQRGAVNLWLLVEGGKYGLVRLLERSVLAVEDIELCRSMTDWNHFALPEAPCPLRAISDCSAPPSASLANEGGRGDPFLALGISRRRDNFRLIPPCRRPMSDLGFSF